MLERHTHRHSHTHSPCHSTPLYYTPLHNPTTLMSGIYWLRYGACLGFWALRLHSFARWGDCLGVVASRLEFLAGSLPSLAYIGCLGWNSLLGAFLHLPTLVAYIQGGCLALLAYIGCLHSGLAGLLEPHGMPTFIAGLYCLPTCRWEDCWDLHFFMASALAMWDLVMGLSICKSTGPS